MATTAVKPAPKAKSDDRFIERVVSLQQLEVERFLTEAMNGKKPVTVAPEQAKQMLHLLQAGSIHLSYDVFAKKEDGSLDTKRPLPKLQYAYIWVGHPDADEAKVLLRNQAIRGDSKNANAIIEVVEKGRNDGTKATYYNTVGVRISGWALNQDQASYEAWLKERGLKVPEAAQKQAPKGDAIPVGEAKDAAPAAFEG